MATYFAIERHYTGGPIMRGELDELEICDQAYRCASRFNDLGEWPFEEDCDGALRQIAVSEAIDYLERRLVDDGRIRKYLPLDEARRFGIRATGYGKTIEMSAAEVCIALDGQANEPESI